VYHLGCLLEQEFKSHLHQMVTIVINPKGIPRSRPACDSLTAPRISARFDTPRTAWAAGSPL